MSLLHHNIRLRAGIPFLRCISLVNIPKKWQLLIARSFSCTPLMHTPSSCRTPKFEDSPKFKAFKAKQAKMQCDDGYPVHLKGGTFDKILYHITVGGCVIGLIQCLWVFYRLATKSKQ